MKTYFRELSFEDKISSLCFANNRGDLLIGRSEQIILVKMQDYLPPKYLIKALQLEISDDHSESIMDFDPNIEFWDYPQISEKKMSESKKNMWHFRIQ